MTPRERAEALIAEWFGPRYRNGAAFADGIEAAILAAERAAFERAEEEIRQCGRGLRDSLATHYRAMADRVRALALAS